MTTLGLIIAALLAAGVLYLAFVSAHWGEDGQVPAQRPTWLGPDAVALCTAVTTRILDERRRRGLADPHPCGAVDELARHHAFDMAARDYGRETDPEGEDLGGRRHRLHPDYVGRLWEWDRLLEPEGPSTEESLLAALFDEAGLAALEAQLASAEVTAIGVGVTVEHGRCGVCVVFGAHLATLSRIDLGEAGVGGWELRGELAPEVSLADVWGQLIDADGAALPRVDAGPVDTDPPRPRDFRLQLGLDGDPQGYKAEIWVGEQLGLRRSLH